MSCLPQGHPLNEDLPGQLKVEMTQNDLNHRN